MMLSGELSVRITSPQARRLQMRGQRALQCSGHFVCISEFVLSFVGGSSRKLEGCFCTEVGEDGSNR